MHRAALVALGAGLLLAAGAAQAALGTITIPGGSLIISGTIANATVNVSGSGILGGDGSIVGDVSLAPSGSLVPGATGAVGQLDGNAFAWTAGGTVAFQLGSNDALSDHLAFSGAFTRQGSGSYLFQFGDGAAPPTPGTTYTLATFASQSGFAASDFSYAYSGSAAALNGQFQLTPNALLFTVISTPVELQSFDVD